MRNLPSLATLRAFESAARLGSFKDAASELSLSPTAISHQVRNLEKISGQQLFDRQTRAVSLTEVGKEFYNTLTPGLKTISTAYDRLWKRSRRLQVTLGAGPVFASRWLVPRLSDFLAKNQTIDLWLHHSSLAVWEQMDQYDLAIAWGNGNWKGVTAERLFSISMSPVVATSLGYGKQPRAPSELLNFPLLHHRDMTNWSNWFSQFGIRLSENSSGVVFDDANILLQAALEGRGVALGILQFIQDDLKTERLIQPFDKAIESPDAYFLIYKANSILNEAEHAVCNWLRQE